MQDCCTKSNQSNDSTCYLCKQKGKQIKLITLKSLLTPVALEQLEANSTYYFCPTPECKVVYYNENGDHYRQKDIKVPVYQKDTSKNTPVCYCFGWTRERLLEEINETGKSSAPQHISQHIKAKRCGCEVNNPQGSCCLGNITEFIKKAVPKR